MSEPLAFGIGSGLFYIHIPFMAFNNGPAISFRTMPGTIFKRTCKAMKVDVERKKFRSESEAERFLNQKIEEGCSSRMSGGGVQPPLLPKGISVPF